MQLQVIVKAHSRTTGLDRASIEARLVAELNVATNLSGAVRIVDSLLNDGMVIESLRDYEAS